MPVQKTAILSTSWNGTPLMYNRESDTWDRADNAILGPQHHATAADMPDAIEAAAREKVLLSTDPELCAIED